ncbi:hypothetical protein QBC32DRAFT_386551, partial [Pseudoneurospora amorphoporcata]
MSSSHASTNTQPSLIQGEQPVDNDDSKSSNRNTQATFPSTPIRSSPCSSPPVTPVSDLGLNCALVSSPTTPAPKVAYMHDRFISPSPLASPNSVGSSPPVSPVPPSQAHWVRLAMPWDNHSRNSAWYRPGFTPTPAFGPPTPPGMTAAEQEDFQRD